MASPPPEQQLPRGGRRLVSMRFSGPFLDELAALSKPVEERIWSKLELVESFPGVGSSLVEPILLRAFGSKCLKVSAAGYDVIYEREGSGEDEMVYALGIISQRRIR